VPQAISPREQEWCKESRESNLKLRMEHNYTVRTDNIYTEGEKKKKTRGVNIYKSKRKTAGQFGSKWEKKDKKQSCKASNTQKI